MSDLGPLGEALPDVDPAVGDAGSPEPGQASSPAADDAPVAGGAAASNKPEDILALFGRAFWLLTELAKVDSGINRALRQSRREFINSAFGVGGGRGPMELKAVREDFRRHLVMGRSIVLTAEEVLVRLRDTSSLGGDVVDLL